MKYVPAVLAFFAVQSEIWPRLRDCSPLCLKSFCLVFILAAALLGLPMRLAITLATCKLIPRPELQRTLSAALSRSDVVLSDHAALFEAKQSADLVYDPFYSVSLHYVGVGGAHDFTWEEKRAINVLIIRPQDAGLFTNYLGGKWQAVSAPFGDTQDFHRLERLPVVGRRLAHYAAQPQTERYQLQIFRRLTDAPRAAAIRNP
jgi:hypothetical protein